MSRHTGKFEIVEEAISDTQLGMMKKIRIDCKLVFIAAFSQQLNKVRNVHIICTKFQLNTSRMI